MYKQVPEPSPDGQFVLTFFWARKNLPVPIEFPQSAVLHINGVISAISQLIFNSHKIHVQAYAAQLWQKENLWQFTQLWKSDVFRLDLACSASIPSFEHKHSSCWEIFMSRHHDIALMSMCMADTFCSFTRNVNFQSCFLFRLLSEYGSMYVETHKIGYPLAIYKHVCTVKMYHNVPDGTVSERNAKHTHRPTYRVQTHTHTHTNAHSNKHTHRPTYKHKLY